MSEIVWEDPPATKFGTVSAGAWVRRLSPLLEHPGRWALVSGEFSTGVAAQLKAGKVRTPPGRWEFTSRGAGDGSRRGKIYARYLGPDEKDQS